MRLRLAQYGTGHGHAAGKLMAMLANSDVEVAGVFEPDASRRSVLDKPGSAYHGVRWYSSEQELLGDPSIAGIASEGRNDESLGQTLSIVRAASMSGTTNPRAIAGKDGKRSLLRRGRASS